MKKFWLIINETYMEVHSGELSTRAKAEKEALKQCKENDNDHSYLVVEAVLRVGPPPVTAPVVTEFE